MERRVLFSERNGLVEPRRILVGELSREARVRLWSLLHDSVLEPAESERRDSSKGQSRYRAVRRLWDAFFHWPSDEFLRNRRSPIFRKAYFELTWSRVLDLLEFVRAS